ncbi:DegQ family serine endoprotease [Massilia sp. CF038]|uniref:DegQ family serine endoprotease n=1 Tax=Massilia sp. CF038 TaxID=1881045 RepID=UPI00091C7CCC|nr:DegQ family serine endoprotease [Massilia sp. CF038]SHG60511.1 serine protease Do [Massilia sp. CF038]
MTFRLGRTFFCSMVLASAGLLALQAPLHAAPVATPLVTGLPDFTDVIDKVGPGVVNIRTSAKAKPTPGGPTEEQIQEFFQRRFGIPLPQAPRGRRGQPQDEEVQRGVGSGFIISNDGYVLTNAHVVEGADEVLVTLTDRREFKAKVLGADARSDVALLKVEASNLPHLQIGDSDKIRVGEWVIAIGSPFNLENTVTAGIISAKARDTGDLLPMIQSDVAVNPGNSGGPLINMYGKVIGINSQIATLSGGYNGISFAVPIDEAMRVSEQLKQSGKVTRGRIGVQILEIGKDLAESLGLGQARGLEVVRVEAGGPADKAGIKVGDIILKFNGKAIEKNGDLQRLVGSLPIGSTGTVTLWRRGAQQDLAVKVSDLDGQAKGKDKSDAPKAPKPEQAANAIGLKVSDLTEAQREELGVKGGVLVEASEGAAARAGLQEGDVILQLNTAEVKDAKQFNALISRLEASKTVALLVRRDETTRYVVIRPRK